MFMKAYMHKHVYEGLNARSIEYVTCIESMLVPESMLHVSKVYFCKMNLTCVSSKLCEFILSAMDICPMPNGN